MFQVGDALELLRRLPPASAHMCVTSPPYYGKRSYLPDEHPSKELELGRESSLEAFVSHLVLVFREVRRVLRDDGTLWLNIGDSYARADTPKRAPWPPGTTAAPGGGKANDLPPKNLLMVPARVALALQADGWILRSNIIWAKPNALPSSVQDRPTSSHEHLFLFSKQSQYFYDADAIREEHSPESLARQQRGRSDHHKWTDGPGDQTIANDVSKCCHPGGRNSRDVWTIPTQPLAHKHYATFPERLVTPCIKAGTSQAGVCVECNAPWERVVDVGETSWERRKSDGESMRYGTDGSPTPSGRKLSDKADRNFGVPATRTSVGWRPTCTCDVAARFWDWRTYLPVPKAPSVVLDPFLGSGTTAIVAERLGRDWIGFDLDERNREICEIRLAGTQIELAL